MKKLRNTNPLGAVDLPLIGKSIEAGEEFTVSNAQADQLLEQVGNYELVDPPIKPKD